MLNYRTDGRTHASYGGYCVAIKGFTRDRQDVYCMTFVGSARMVKPKGNYADAPTCELYFHTGSGYYSLANSN